MQLSVQGPPQYLHYRRCKHWHRYHPCRKDSCRSCRRIRTRRAAWMWRGMRGWEWRGRIEWGAVEKLDAWLKEQVPIFREALDVLLECLTEVEIVWSVLDGLRRWYRVLNWGYSKALLLIALWAYSRMIYHGMFLLLRASWLWSSCSWSMSYPPSFPDYVWGLDHITAQALWWRNAVVLTVQIQLSSTNNSFTVHRPQSQVLKRESYKECIVGLRVDIISQAALPKPVERLSTKAKPLLDLR